MPALLALLALTLGGAPATPGTGGNAMTPPAPALSGTTWTLTSLKVGGETITPGRLLVRPSFRLSGTSVMGSTGCSPLKARVLIQGQTIRFRDIDPGSSDRCPDHALSLRDDFTTLLGAATRSELQGDVLTLYAPAGALVFRRMLANPAGRPGR